ncbi:MAG: hypothetical protein ABSG36_02315 [Acidimicrobiales bacterium]
MDAYGRVLTLLAIAAFSAALAAAAVTIIHAVSKLPPWPWLFFLWAGIGVMIFVIGLIAALSMIGGRMVVSERADSCWTDAASAPNYGFVCIGAVLITNTDRNWSFHPTRVRARKVRFDGKRKRDAVFVGRLTPTGQSSEWEIPPGMTVPYAVNLVVPARVGVTNKFNPDAVSARIDLRDQFQRWHPGRGRVEFLKPPTP